MGNIAYSCVESISSDHTFDFYPPTNLIQLLLLRPLRLFFPSRHPFLRELKFKILRITHAPFVLGVTLFEQIFHARRGAGARSSSATVFRPPSLRSARVAASRAGLYSQIPISRKKKVDVGMHGHRDDAGIPRSAEILDIQRRMMNLEDEMKSVKSMLQEILGKL